MSSGPARDDGSAAATPGGGIGSGEPAAADPSQVSWRWATVLAVQPLLCAAALAGVLLFAVTTTAASSSGVPEFVPLVPGAVTLLVLGVAYLYTPLYVVGLWVDVARLRRADAAWRPSRRVLLAACAQGVYFVVPIAQAAGGGTFEELTFGAVELAALLLAGGITARYLHARDAHAPGAPTFVSLCAAAWAVVDRRPGSGRSSA